MVLPENALQLECYEARLKSNKKEAKTDLVAL